MRETKRDIPLPSIINAPCPVHGKQKFIRLDRAQVYACVRTHEFEATCLSVMPFDSIGPDGGDVVDFIDLRFEQALTARDLFVEFRETWVRLRKQLA